MIISRRQSLAISSTIAMQMSVALSEIARSPSVELAQMGKEFRLSTAFPNVWIEIKDTLKVTTFMTKPMRSIRCKVMVEDE